MKFVTIIIIVLYAGNLFAQDTVPSVSVKQSNYGESPLRNFMLTGNGLVNFEKTNNKDKPSWHGAAYPILLWKISGKLFFESEMAIEVGDGEAKAEVEYATLHYEINKYFRIGAGKFLSPFGTYQERLHPGWINKLPEAPLGFSHHSGMAIGPVTEVGIQIRGGAPLGSSKINYSAYLSNGPVLAAEINTSSHTHSGSPVTHLEIDTMMVLESGSFQDNNADKAFGGRFGFLPFSNSSLELGISRQNAKVGDTNDSLFSRAKAVMHAFDLSYVKAFSSFKGIVDIKGQFNHLMIDKTDISSTVSMDSMSNSSAMFGISSAYYMQLSFRPALLEKKIIKNMELSMRYSTLSVTEMGMPSDRKTQLSLGFNYWFSWRSVIKFVYQIPQENGKKDDSVFLIQMAVAHPRINIKKKKITRV